MFAYGSRVGEVPEAPCPDLTPLAKVSVNGRSERKRRKMFSTLPFGVVSGLAPVCRDTNHVPTQVDALKRRLCRQLPTIDPILLAEFRDYVVNWVEHNLSPLNPTQILSFGEWLDSAPYPGNRKRELLTVYEESKGAWPSYLKASKVMAFIKTESYPISVDGTFKAARWICSRNDGAKVVLGPWMKSIEKVLYENHHFIKHVPVSERWKLISGLISPGSKYAITDYTAFESSFASELMDSCECVLYRYMLQAVPGAGEYVTKILTGKQRIRTRAGVSVTLKGRRMSGDMNTSLGNGFTNLMLMKFACHKLGSTFDGYVEGDDGVFAVQGELPVPAFFARLGFEIKLATVTDPRHGGFCGVIAADGGSIRDPVRFFQNFGWTASCIEAGPTVMKQLLRAKAMSALQESPACPLVAAAAERALELTQGVEPRWEYDGYHIPRVNYEHVHHEISPATRDLFHAMYRIDSHQQILLEQQIRESTSLDFLYPHLAPPQNHSLYWLWFVGG